MENSKNRSGCLISCSLDAIGDKWSLLIVRDLMFAKQCTFGDFLKSEEKIATNILASRLKTLEEHCIIQKLEHPESKAKVLYQLTQKGIDLLPIIVELNLWAEKYNFSIQFKILCRLVGRGFYCCLDGYQSYKEISITYINT